MASGWSSFMSPDPGPSLTTSLSRARISNRLLPVGRATTRWKLLVPMSMAATGMAASGASDTIDRGYPPTVTGSPPSVPIARTIATELGVREHQVTAAVDLLDGG